MYAIFMDDPVLGLLRKAWHVYYMSFFSVLPQTKIWHLILHNDVVVACSYCKMISKMVNKFDLNKFSTTATFSQISETFLHSMKHLNCISCVCFPILYTDKNIIIPNRAQTSTFSLYLFKYILYVWAFIKNAHIYLYYSWSGSMYLVQTTVKIFLDQN